MPFGYAISHLKIIKLKLILKIEIETGIEMFNIEIVKILVGF